MPAFSVPQNDELLSSWITRLAHDHFLKVHVFCSLVFKGIQIWNRDIDRSANDQLIDVLEKRTRLSKDKILECILNSFEGKLFLKDSFLTFNKFLLPLGVYHRNRKKFGLMFCPSCLNNDGELAYYRKKWRLSISTVCSTCNTMLSDHCPQCFSPIIFFRNDLGQRNLDPINKIYKCYNCGFDLRNSKTEKAELRFIKMQNEFERHIYTDYDKYLYPHQYFEVLYQIAKILNSVSPNTRILREVVEKKCDVKFSDENLPLYFLGVKARQSTFFGAYWLLSEWPRRIINICERYKIWSSVLLKDFDNSPYWFYKEIYGGLYVSNVNRRFW